MEGTSELCSERWETLDLPLKLCDSLGIPCDLSEASTVSAISSS